jgi:hypothetical protein
MEKKETKQGMYTPRLSFGFLSTMQETAKRLHIDTTLNTLDLKYD